VFAQHGMAWLARVGRMSRPLLTIVDSTVPRHGITSVVLLERIAGNMRPLLEHLAREEKRHRLCPLCRCEHHLEAHHEDCAYEDARFALALFDKVVGHIDNYSERA